MKKPRSSNRESRRAARDKSILDHLTSGPLKPQSRDEQDEARQYNEQEGRKLEKAIHEEWKPEKGGLPDF